MKYVYLPFRDQINKGKQIDIRDNPAILRGDDKSVLKSSNMCLVGGLDISYPTWDHSLACGCLVIYNILTKTVVYQQIIEETVSIPYIPGFLAYRELAVFQKLFHNLKQYHPEFFPHILLVDGQGTYHPRHFGSACAIGLELNIPTIGVAKNPFCGPLFEQDSMDKQIILNDNEVDVCWSLSTFQTRMRNGVKHSNHALSNNIDKNHALWRVYWKDVLQGRSNEAYLCICWPQIKFGSSSVYCGGTLPLSST